MSLYPEDWPIQDWPTEDWQTEDWQTEDLFRLLLEATFVPEEDSPLSKAGCSAPNVAPAPSAEPSLVEAVGLFDFPFASNDLYRVDSGFFDEQVDSIGR